MFKGGTSLSKAFGIIRRFSEDIDLSFDRADLGYTGVRDPEWEGLSRKKAGQLIDDLVTDVEKHIAENLLPALRAAIIHQLGEPKNGEWSLSIDTDDPQTLNFHYPPVLPAGEYQGVAYITPRVKLELGARGDPWPAEEKVIRPYAVEDFPDFFENPDTTVTARTHTQVKKIVLRFGLEADVPEDNSHGSKRRSIASVGSFWRGTASSLADAGVGFRRQTRRMDADGKNYVNSLFKMLHPHGSHPGLSDEDQCPFRLHIVLVTARTFLRRLRQGTQRQHGEIEAIEATAAIRARNGPGRRAHAGFRAVRIPRGVL